MIVMVLPGTKRPSGGESAATLGKGRNLPEPRHGALVARRCDARGMGAHLPPCRFRLDCSGADGRGATRQQQPMRARWRDEPARNRPRDDRQIQNRQRRRSEETAPLPRSERVESKTAVVVRANGAWRRGVLGHWPELQPARGRRAGVRRLSAGQLALGGKRRLRCRAEMQMVMR